MWPTTSLASTFSDNWTAPRFTTELTKFNWTIAISWLSLNPEMDFSSERKFPSHELSTTSTKTNSKDTLRVCTFPRRAKTQTSKTPLSHPCQTWSTRRRAASQVLPKNTKLLSEQRTSHSNKLHIILLSPWARRHQLAKALLFRRRESTPSMLLWNRMVISYSGSDVVRNRYLRI